MINYYYIVLCKLKTYYISKTYYIRTYMLTFEDTLEAEQYEYHFALSEIVDKIDLYGYDAVIDDIKDYYHKRQFDRMYESEF